MDNAIVDTGAADTIIAIEPLQRAADEDDVIVRMAGLGGFDYAVRKALDTLAFAGYTLMRPSVDFGNFVGTPVSTACWEWIYCCREARFVAI